MFKRTLVGERVRLPRRGRDAVLSRQVGVSEDGEAEQARTDSAGRRDACGLIPLVALHILSLRAGDHGASVDMPPLPSPQCGIIRIPAQRTNMAEEKGQLQTLDRAFAALRAVAEAPRPLSVADVAGAIGTGTTIAFRIVRSLEAHGYLERTPQKRYRAAASAGMTRTLRQGLALLGVVARAGPAGAAVGELAAHSGLTDVQTTSALGELGEAELVTALPGGRWAISPGILALARPVLGGDAPLAAVRPAMRELLQAYGETLTWFRRSGGDTVVVEVMPSPQPLRYVLDVGTRFPLYLGAAGKAYLAALPQDEAAAYVGSIDLRPLTRHVPDPMRLAAEIEEVRERGYAATVGERVEGAASVAAAIRAAQGEVAGVVSVMAPVLRTDKGWAATLGAELVARTRDLFGGNAGDVSGRAA